MSDLRHWAPRPDELLLLRAALLDGSVAINAWRQFRERHTRLEHLDSNAYWLLPQLFCNLRALKVEDHELGRLKGTYRREWYANQRLLEQGLQVIAALRAVGIDVMLLGGSALVLQLRDLGARPIDDVDLLVRPHDAERTLEALRAAGWESGEARSGSELLRFRSAVPLLTTDRRRLNLHWSALYPRSCDADLWNDSIAISLRGVDIRTPCPTDHLLLACAHGLDWTPGPPRWIADAMLVLRMAGDRLDWPGLARRARDRHLTLDLTDALEFLADKFSIRPPPELMAALRRPRVGGPERLLHQIKMTPRRRNPVSRLVRRTARQWDYARRLAMAPPIDGERPVRPFEYLGDEWMRSRRLPAPP